MTTTELNTNQMVIYETQDGNVKVDVTLYGEDVWLTQQQIAEIFAKDRSVITKHINAILSDAELEDSVCANFAHTASDGKVYNTKYYNLDMIISVGYRVNSKQAIQFRRWASSVLKEYLIGGYSINRDKIAGDRLLELQQAVELLSKTLINQNLVNDDGIELLELFKGYTKTWEMLLRYDESSLEVPKHLHESNDVILDYGEAVKAISSFQNELGDDAQEFFGKERDGSFEGILAGINQTFEGQALYPTIEERATHLLYFVIKDHPFSDGNKRIGSLMFLLYWKKAKLDFSMINASNMTSLALLVAESDPSQKELMIKLIMNLVVIN